MGCWSYGDRTNRWSAVTLKTFVLSSCQEFCFCHRSTSSERVGMIRNKLVSCCKLRPQVTNGFFRCEMMIGMNARILRENKNAFAVSCLCVEGA